MADANPMTLLDQVSVSGDDSALHPSMDDPGVMPRREVRLRLEAAREEISTASVSSTVNQPPMAVRVCCVWASSDPASPLHGSVRNSDGHSSTPS